MIALPGVCIRDTQARGVNVSKSMQRVESFEGLVYCPEIAEWTQNGEIYLPCNSVSDDFVAPQAASWSTPAA